MIYRLCLGLDGAAPRNAQRSQSFGHAVLSLWNSGCFVGQDSPCGTLSIGRIILTAQASTGTIRTVDLDGGNPLALEKAGQASAVGPRTFDAGAVQLAKTSRP